jgi:hypothetical protein
MALRQLALCDGVALLPGWQDSRGARIEHQLATQLGLIVVPECTIMHGPEFADA